jgi:uncharacterized protein YbjT (DUF2867 family)
MASIVREHSVCVFGGAGFLGRRIVGHLRARGLPVRVASRHPAHARQLFGSAEPQIEAVRADIEDRRSLAPALAGMAGVVNAVSLYVEHGPHTFRSVHVEAAGNLAAEAREAGIGRFIHVSGVGTDPLSVSPYIRSRAEGERAVQAAFPNATIARPTVMFGVDDAFLNAMLTLVERLPVFPIFGTGGTRLQPVSVEDVGEAIVRAFDRDPAVYELGGPEVYEYRQLVQTITRQAGSRSVVWLVCPVPFAAWDMLARLAELLPSPPLTRNQVDLMKFDTVASTSMPGFEALGIRPQRLEPVLQSILSQRGASSPRQDG